MSTFDVAKASESLKKAKQERVGMAPLTKTYEGLTTHQAYQVQIVTIQEEVQKGKRIVGKKIGLTSKAMQDMFGVDEPDYGHLLDDMVVENGGEISFSRVMQPRVEAEIAFILKEELKGPNVTTLDVLLATKYVVPALEIVDSRIQDWKITLPDTVADNASSGLFVLGGKPVKVEDVDLAQLGMVLYKNGEMMNTGVGAAALGHPAHCVAWLANKLSEFDISLKKGEVILSGALSAAVSAETGDEFRARFAHLGEVSVKFKEE